MILGLRKKAAEIGCDAVVITAETGNIAGSVTQGNVNTRTIKSYRAVCAMYTEAEGPTLTQATVGAKSEAPRTRLRTAARKGD